MFEKLCAPVILYIGFCLIHIIVDLVQHQYRQSLVKMFVMIILGIVLQVLCNRGLSIVSWLIVFVPFIMFTYITAIIMFVFGLKPTAESVSKKATITVVKN